MARKGQFQKGNKLGFTTNRTEPLTKLVGLRISDRQKEALKNIPNWQEKLRLYIDQMIKNGGENYPQ